MGLRVEPPDETTSVEDRERVVPVPPLGGGSVDLDPVVEAPQIKETSAVPDDRIEWREKRCTHVSQNAVSRLAGEPHVGRMDVAGRLPPFHLNAANQSFIGQTFEERGCALDRSLEVVGHPLRLCDA